jgi:G3E family GTPase
MLSNGCVCCQIGSDLAFTIDRLIAAPRPDGAGPLRRIILETSGLSRPGPVLRTLATLAEHRMKVAVVGTFDLTRGMEVASFEEAVAQWAAAHRIVVTKADLAAAEDLAGAPAKVAGVNPLAELIAIADRADAVQAGFAPLGAAPPMREIGPEMPRVHPRIALCVARPVANMGYADLAAWLDNLAGLLGERLLRLKGLVQARRPPFLVIIARDVNESDLHIPPFGLFRLSSWSAPDVPPRGSARAIRAEWVG